MVGRDAVGLDYQRQIWPDELAQGVRDDKSVVQSSLLYLLISRSLTNISSTSRTAVTLASGVIVCQISVSINGGS